MNPTPKTIEKEIEFLRLKVIGLYFKWQPIKIPIHAMKSLHNRVFQYTPGHRCKQDICTLHSLKRGVRFFIPGKPFEIYTASGIVFLCQTTNTVHLCTLTRCDHIIRTLDSQCVCTISGRNYGSVFVNIPTEFHTTRARVDRFVDKKSFAGDPISGESITSTSENENYTMYSNQSGHHNANSGEYYGNEYGDTEMDIYSEYGNNTSLEQEFVGGMDFQNTHGEQMDIIPQNGKHNNRKIYMTNNYQYSYCGTKESINTLLLKTTDPRKYQKYKLSRCNSITEYIALLQPYINSSGIDRKFSGINGNNNNNNVGNISSSTISTGKGNNIGRMYGEKNRGSSRNTAYKENSNVRAVSKTKYNNPIHLTKYERLTQGIAKKQIVCMSIINQLLIPRCIISKSQFLRRMHTVNTNIRKTNRQGIIRENHINLESNLNKWMFEFNTTIPKKIKLQSSEFGKRLYDNVIRMWGIICNSPIIKFPEKYNEMNTNASMYFSNTQQNDTKSVKKMGTTQHKSNVVVSLEKHVVGCLYSMRNHGISKQVIINKKQIQEWYSMDSNASKPISVQMVLRTPNITTVMPKYMKKEPFSLHQLPVTQTFAFRILPRIPELNNILPEPNKLDGVKYTSGKTVRLLSKSFVRKGQITLKTCLGSISNHYYNVLKLDIIAATTNKQIAESLAKYINSYNALIP